MIKMILATGENGELGLDGELPWDCPEDLAYFKKCTLNKDVIMGRTTFDSLPFKYGLPDRFNYVLTSKPTVNILGITIPAVCFDRNIKLCNLDFITKVFENYYSKVSDIWVIGGKSVYSVLLSHVQEIHHTTIKGDFDADVHFDTSFLEGWEHVSSEILSEKAVVKVYRRKDGIG